VDFDLITIPLKPFILATMRRSAPRMARIGGPSCLPLPTRGSATACSALAGLNTRCVSSVAGKLLRTSLNRQFEGRKPLLPAIAAWQTASRYYGLWRTDAEDLNDTDDAASNASDAFFASKLHLAGSPAPPFPHRYTDEVAVDRLLLKLLAELRPEGAAATASPANIVVLACPHPGATGYLEDVALKSARVAGADVVSLDYLDLLEHVGSIPPEDLAPNGPAAEAWDQIEAPEFRYVAPFKPSEYGKVGASNGRDSATMSRDQNEDDDLEEDENSPYETSQFEEEEDDGDHQNGVFPEEEDIDFEWGGGTGNPRFEDSNAGVNVPRSANSSSSSSTSRDQQPGSSTSTSKGKHGVQLTFSASDVSSIKSQMASFIGGNPADGSSTDGRSTAVSSADDLEIPTPLDLSCDLVAARLVSFVRNRRSSKPVVIYIKDLNEFNTPYSSAVGPRVLESLTGSVNALRASGHPALLVAGATPSLTDPHPHEPPEAVLDSFEFQRAETERAEFYRTILSGDRMPVGYRPRDGLRAPYRHILSDRTNPVSTVYLPPPPLPENSLTSNTSSLLPRTDEDSPAAVEEAFVGWEKTMALDRQSRVAQLNWRTVLAECGRRGIGIEDHVLGAILAGEEELPDVESAGRVWSRAEDALLVRGFLRYGNQWEEVSALVNGRLPESCKARWTELMADDRGAFVPADAELGTFLASLRDKLWGPEMIREVVTNANGVRLREAAVSGAKAAPQPFLTLKQVMEGVEMEQMNDPAYRRQKHAAKVADRRRKVDELKREPRGSGRGDGGGLAALADTVDNREDSFNPKVGAGSGPTHHNLHNSHASSESSALDENGRPESHAIRNLLSQRGHKLNAYEKKLLGCVVDPAVIPVGFQDLVLPPSTKLALQTLVTLPLLRPKLFSHGILQKSSFSGVLLFGPVG